MKHWSAQRVAGTAGGELVREPYGGRAAGGPAKAAIDSRAIQPGDLFFGLPGENVDGGEYAAAALDAGAWGVVVEPHWVDDLFGTQGGAIIATPTPVPALGALARGWRQDLAAFVIGVTGSVGKTSTKDLIAAMIAPHRSIAASRENYNTEIGLPLEILAAPWGTEVLVLEMAMRGFGQIRELAAIAEPDVGVITNIGPVHLEQMGSLEGVAEAKAELLDGLQPGGTAVVPSDEPLLEPWLRDDLEVDHLRPGRGRLLRGLVAEVRRRARRAADPARGDRAGRAGRARAAVRLPAQPAQRFGGPGRRRGRSGCTRAARSTCASPRCGGSAWRSDWAPS